jgi:hypothetical protein
MKRTLPDNRPLARGLQTVVPIEYFLYKGLGDSMRQRPHSCTVSHSRILLFWPFAMKHAAEYSHEHVDWRVKADQITHLCWHCSAIGGIRPSLSATSVEGVRHVQTNPENTDDMPLRSLEQTICLDISRRSVPFRLSWPTRRLPSTVPIPFE